MDIHTILLDLDCVLCHFVKGCAAEWGLTIDELMPRWPAGEYGMNGPLCRALKDKGDPEWPHDRIMTDGTFWNRLNGNAEFWAGLEKLPWCDDLVEVCRDLVGENNVHT